jgi:hypothetical protein
VYVTAFSGADVLGGRKCSFCCLFGPLGSVLPGLAHFFSVVFHRAVFASHIFI